jgi:hypothetical protein
VVVAAAGLLAARDAEQSPHGLLAEVEFGGDLDGAAAGAARYFGVDELRTAQAEALHRRAVLLYLLTETALGLGERHGVELIWHARTLPYA